MDGVDEEVDEGEETHGEGGEDHGIVYSKTPPTTPTGMPSKICPKDNITNQSTSKSTSPLNSKIIKPDFKTSSTFSNKSSEDAELLLKDREAYKIKLMSRVTDGNVRDSLEKVSFQTAIIKARNTQSYC